MLSKFLDFTYFVPLKFPITMIKRIILNTEYFEQDDVLIDDQITKRVEELNEPEEKTLNLAPDRPIEQVETPEVDLSQVSDKEEVEGASGTKYNRRKLMKQCAELGVKFEMKDNAETLKSKILAFQG